MSSIDGLKLIAPRRCSPSPGSPLKSGRRSTARLTLPDEPRNLKRRTSSSNEGSSVPGSSRPRNVRLESSDDRIESAWISSPDSSATPTARPPLTMTFATGASVRISAPSARAASPIALLIPPVPPLGMPHARNAPSISPM